MITFVSSRNGFILLLFYFTNMLYHILSVEARQIFAYGCFEQVVRALQDAIPLP